jgi:hypothetical protein
MALFAVGSQPAWAATTFTDTTTSDFNSGSNYGTQVTNTSGGEVSSALIYSDFNVMPDNWTTVVESTGGSAVVSGGNLVVDGARSGSDTRTTSGSSLVANAKISGAAYQNIGFGQDYQSSGYAVFGTASGGALYAETDGGTTTLSSSYLGSFHTYRIDWLGESFNFYIDNTLVASLGSPKADVSMNLRPLIEDATTGSGNVSVNNLSVTKAPLPNTDFSAMPSNWTTVAEDTGGTATVSSGQLHVDGARSGSDVRVSSGSTLTAVATISGDASENIGFTQDFQDDSAGFGTQSGGALYAIVATGGVFTTVTLSSSYLGSSHTYQIVWRGEDFVFNVDGTQVADIPASKATTSQNFRPMFEDASTGGGTVDVDSLVVTKVSYPSFDFSSSPTDWTTTVENTGGSASVTGGSLVVDGARSGSDLRVTSGTSMSAVATISGDAYENIGFTQDFQDDSAGFGTRSGGALYAIVATGGVFTTVTLSSSYLGHPHTYRVDWRGESFVYFIDGVQKASISASVSTTSSNFRPMFEDASTGGGTLSVDSVTVSRFTQHYISAVHDSGLTAPVTWGTLGWTATAPTGTSLSVYVRSGNTATPGGGWTAFAPITNGGSITQTGRYLQYELIYTPDDAADGPVVSDVTAS